MDQPIALYSWTQMHDSTLLHQSGTTKTIIEMNLKVQYKIKQV